jgi:hypothetical protein
MDKDTAQTQIDPLKIIAPLREKLSTSQLQEAILSAMLDDANRENMKLRTALQEAETDRNLLRATLREIEDEGKE